MGRETYTGAVAFEVRGELGIITLNRPHALNSLTRLMCECLLVQLEDWAVDPTVSQVLIRGAGDRGLCAGGDVVSFYEDMTAHQGEDGGPLLPDGTPAYGANFDAEEFLAAEYSLNRLIAEYPKPYIALMDGVVLGGGVGVSAHGSHRIVTERSRVGMPETTIGFSPDVGGSHLLGRAPGALGVHAGMTGIHLSGADAVHVGLADAVVPSSRLEELIQALTQDHADVVVGSFREEPGVSQLEQDAVWINQAYSQDTVEEILRTLDELGAEYPRAAEAGQTLRTKSPTMLKVALRALRSAAALTLSGALSQEYTIAVHALRSHDFREGIRAQVVEKDRNPRWRPSTVEAVDTDLVEHYFTPVPGKILVMRAQLTSGG